MRAANFLRDLVRKEVILPSHVPGVIMLADLLTKAVSRSVYLRLRSLLDSYADDGVAAMDATK